MTDCLKLFFVIRSCLIKKKLFSATMGNVNSLLFDLEFFKG